MDCVPFGVYFSEGQLVGSRPVNHLETVVDVVLLFLLFHLGQPCQGHGFHQHFLPFLEGLVTFFLLHLILIVGDGLRQMRLASLQISLAQNILDIFHS